MILCRLQALALTGVAMIIVGYLRANQLVNITDSVLKLGRRKLAQVSTEIRFQSVAIGSDVEATIQQVKQLQHDQSNRRMVITHAHHFTIG